MSDDLVQRVEAALPIDDLVGWLVQEYPGASEREVMGMLQVIYQSDYDIQPAAQQERTYQVGAKTWDAYPQRVLARDAK